MKKVSLNKVSKSVVTKVAGLSVLGVIAIAFCLAPLASFAMDICGNEHITPEKWIPGATTGGNTGLKDYIANPTLKSPVFEPFGNTTKVSNDSIITGLHDIRADGKTIKNALCLVVVVGGQAFGLDYDGNAAMSEGDPHHATLPKGVTISNPVTTYFKDKTITVKFWLNGTDLLNYLNNKTNTAPTFQKFDKPGTVIPNGSFLIGTDGNTTAFAVEAGSHTYGLDYTTKAGKPQRPQAVTLANAKNPPAPVASTKS